MSRLTFHQSPNTLVDSMRHP